MDNLGGRRNERIKWAQEGKRWLSEGIQIERTVIEGHLRSGMVIQYSGNFLKYRMQSY